MSQAKDRPRGQYIPLCEACAYMLSSAFHVKEDHESLTTKCGHCGRSSSMVAVYEITSKKKAGKT